MTIGIYVCELEDVQSNQSLKHFPTMLGNATMKISEVHWTQDIFIEKPK